MRFRNKASGNIVTTDNKDSISLMQKSGQYEEVKETAARKSSKKAQAAAASAAE